MVLRRGDWETGDVICHECHLTAPPFPPPPSHLPPQPHLTLFCVSQLPPLLPQLCALLFILFQTQILIFLSFHPLMHNYFTYTGTNATIPTLPIFLLISDSAHAKKRDRVYLNNLFCTPCLNVISPSLLPLLLLPPPSLPHRQISFQRTMRIQMTLGAKNAHKIEGTEMENVNALNRNIHMHTHVKMSSPQTFQQFYFVFV